MTFAGAVQGLAEEFGAPAVRAQGPARLPGETAIGLKAATGRRVRHAGAAPAVLRPVTGPGPVRHSVPARAGTSLARPASEVATAVPLLGLRVGF